MQGTSHAAYICPICGNSASPEASFFERLKSFNTTLSAGEYGGIGFGFELESIPFNFHYNCTLCNKNYEYIYYNDIPNLISSIREIKPEVYINFNNVYGEYEKIYAGYERVVINELIRFHRTGIITEKKFLGKGELWICIRIFCKRARFQMKRKEDQVGAYYVLVSFRGSA